MYSHWKLDFLCHVTSSLGENSLLGENSWLADPAPTAAWNWWFGGTCTILRIDWCVSYEYDIYIYIHKVLWLCFIVGHDNCYWSTLLSLWKKGRLTDPIYNFAIMISWYVTFLIILIMTTVITSIIPIAMRGMRYLP